MSVVNSCVFSSGWEGARCPHSYFGDPSKSACRQMRGSARGRRHPCCQQHQSARCQTQGGCHYFVPAGNTSLHTWAQHATPFLSSCESAHSGCLFQRGQIEFEVVYVAPEVDSDDENVEYEDDSGHHYRLYLDEVDSSSTTPPGNTSASLQRRCSKHCFYPVSKSLRGLELFPIFNVSSEFVFSKSFQ